MYIFCQNFKEFEALQPSQFVKWYIIKTLFWIKYGKLVSVPTLEGFFTWHLNGLLDKTNHLDVCVFFINIDGRPGRLNEYCFHIKEPLSEQSSLVMNGRPCLGWNFN